MIAIIRISGMVNVPQKTEETLSRLRLRRKYCLVLINPTPENLKLLKKIRNYVSYGEVSNDLIVKLIKARGKPIKAGTKIEAEKIVLQLDKKDLQELGLKPFFRLHPPRGGIDAKQHYGTTKNAVLGNNKKISDLIGRML